MTYDSFITQARKYANGSEAERLHLMALLLDTEPRKAFWQRQTNGQPKLTWELFLREEGLCTIGLYRNFKTATSLVDVNVFGVYASAALGKLPSVLRTRIVQQTQAWISSHHLPPTYQRISKYVRDLHTGIAPPRGKRTPIHALRTENNRLKRELNEAYDYIHTLQAALKKAGVRIPREPDAMSSH